MKIVVITAITANRDRLKDRQNTEGADFVAFLDRPVASAIWDVRQASDLFRDPVRNAKIHKILPHLYFPNHEYSLWIDGSVELVDPAPVLVERYLADCDIVFGQHAIHRSLADETESCLSEGRDDPELIRQQVKNDESLVDDRGFPLAGSVLRRHTPEVARFNAVWWAEICRWSRRDMLSLLSALETSGVAWASIPRDPDLDQDPWRRVFGSPHFRWYPHGYDLESSIERPSPASPDVGTPSWWKRRLEFLEAAGGAREAYALSLEHELSRCTEWAKESERYAKNLQEHLEQSERDRAEAERYARSLEEAIRWAGGRPPDN